MQSALLYLIFECENVVLLTFISLSPFYFLFIYMDRTEYGILRILLNEMTFLYIRIGELSSMAASFGSVILTVLIWFLRHINFLVPKGSMILLL